SRGGTPAFLASCSAMLVDQSPCSRPLGRSTRTSRGTSTVKSPADTAWSRAAMMASASCSGVTRPSLVPSGGDAGGVCRDAALPDPHVRTADRTCRCTPVGLVICDAVAPVAQGIEHRPPEAGAQVRILPGAQRERPLTWDNR